MATTIIAFALRETPAVKWKQTSPGALEAVAKHVDASSGKARLSPLDPSGTTIRSGANWRFIAPTPGSPDADTQAIHFLRLPADSPIAALRDALRGDSRVEWVEELRPEHVVLPTPALPATGLKISVKKSAAPPIPAQWSIDRCQFPAVWPAFDTGAHPGAVFVIDNGRPNPLAPIAAGQLNYHPREFGQSSTADHAAAVVGVVAPHRGTVPGFGCSSAKIELFNVFDETGTLDKADLCRALVAAAKAGAAVANMSFTMTDIPRCVETAFQACKRNNVVMVAAMGESSAPSATFPAKHDDVVAVGGTTRAETRHPNWMAGNYMFVSAPAEFIETVGGRLNGTSFAAPHVSAAIWLARRRRPSLSATDIQDLLKQSVFLPAGAKKEDVGHGRLDMAAMAKLI